MFDFYNVEFLSELRSKLAAIGVVLDDSKIHYLGVYSSKAMILMRRMMTAFNDYSTASKMCSDRDCVSTKRSKTCVKLFTNSKYIFVMDYDSQVVACCVSNDGVASKRSSKAAQDGLFKHELAEALSIYFKYKKPMDMPSFIFRLDLGCKDMKVSQDELNALTSHLRGAVVPLNENFTSMIGAITSDPIRLEALKNLRIEYTRLKEERNKETHSLQVEKTKKINDIDREYEAKLKSIDLMYSEKISIVRKEIEKMS